MTLASNPILPDVAPDPGKKETGAGGTRIAADRDDDRVVHDRRSPAALWIGRLALAAALLTVAALVLLRLAWQRWPELVDRVFEAIPLGVLAVAYAAVAVRAVRGTTHDVVRFARVGWAFSLALAFGLLTSSLDGRAYPWTARDQRVLLLTLLLGSLLVAAGSFVVGVLLRESRRRSSIRAVARVLGPPKPFVRKRAGETRLDEPSGTAAPLAADAAHAATGGAG